MADSDPQGAMGKGCPLTSAAELKRKNNQKLMFEKITALELVLRLDPLSTV